MLAPVVTGAVKMTTQAPQLNPTLLCETKARLVQVRPPPDMLVLPVRGTFSLSNSAMATSNELFDGVKEALATLQLLADVALPRPVRARAKPDAQGCRPASSPCPQQYRLRSCARP